MGEDVTSIAFTREDRLRYRRKVRRCLDVFAMMLDDLALDDSSATTGMELEVNLVDTGGNPAMRNAEILKAIADPMFQTELGQFNLEINVPPRLISGDGLARYELQMRTSLEQANARANEHGASLVVIGILPTITPADTVLANLSPNPRYLSLNQQIVDARGGDIAIDISGRERLRVRTDSIGPEAACTSMQLHIQVGADRFATYWNASQAMAAVQVAVGSNSPFLFGRRLWDETRIALFEQSADTRPDEFKSQGVRPRVWFGERWITSVFDLFEENVRYYPPLLPICDDEDPVEVLRAGGTPRLSELRLHNGTIYRWNRPVYDIMDGRPHLRVENRVLPAGPTVVDMLANAAFYFGLSRALAEDDRPIWTQMHFTAAEENFHLGCRDGIGATVWWPRLGEVGVARLVLDRLLSRAAEGLDQYGTAPAMRDRLIGIIEQRCLNGRTGAVWQSETVAHLEDRGLDRQEALHEMLRRYMSYMLTNEPVHTWPIG
jgi:gamma-glutamyl:cysteine ligase YbdK (ATP-grasp superfamily)